MSRYIKIVGAIALLTFFSTSLIAAEKPIEFVADKDYPPIVYLENDVPKGMVVELTRAIGTKMGREVKINLMDWDLAQKKVADGEADIVGPLARSKQREEIYDFSQPCLTCEYALFVRDSEVGIRDLTDLAGMQVGVTPGGFPRQALSEQKSITLTMVENYPSGLEQLQRGKIRALAADRWVAAYYIHERSIQGISIVDKPFATRQLAYAVRKGNTALLDSLNKAIIELRSEGSIDSIADNWAPKKVVIYTQEQMRRMYLIGSAIVVVLLIGSLSIWIYSLRRQIRQRQLAEQSLRESEERFRTLVEQAPEAIAVFDADANHYVHANSKAEQLFGCSREEILKSGPEHFFHTIKSDSVPLSASIRENSERVFSGEQFTVERVLRAPDGKERYCEVRGVRFPSANHRLIRVSYIEITARKQAEAELENYRNQLEERVRQRTEALEKEIAERKRIEEALRLAKDGAEAASEAKSTFLASMSHEIRTPLNAILGYSHLLKRDKNLSEKHAQALSSISSSGEHLLDLLSDILAMSSIEAGRTTLDENPFDLHELLQSLQSMFGLRAQEKALKLSVELHSNLPRHIRADQRKLRQILFNLMSNAVRFTQSGNVTLRARAAADDILEFEVEDTGPGITPREQAALFEPFAQTAFGRRVQGGAGLGLAISRGFVELMGGQIGVRSEPGKGSCFHFTIRARGSEPLPPPLVKEPERVLRIRPMAQPRRILVVDDHSESRKLLIDLLRTAGFDVRGAADGSEAVRVWDEWCPHFIWMDMNMPIMDGYHATREILERDTTKQTVIVALTASVFAEDRARIISSGCADCLAKPFREEAIFGCLAKHLGVEYEREAASAGSLNAESLDSIAAKIRALPADPLERIRRSTRTLDVNALAKIADELAADHPVVAQFLKRSAEQLDFDALDRVLSNTAVSR